MKITYHFHKLAPILVMTVAVLGSGCSASVVRMYRGPQLPRERIAVVHNRGRLKVTAVDKAVSAQDRQRAAEWLVTLAVYADDREAAMRDAERVVEIARGTGPSEHAFAVVTLARA